jgi:hypothetical protein
VNDYKKNAEEISTKLQELLSEVSSMENWAIGLNDLEEVKKWQKLYGDLVSIEFHL